MNGKQAKRLRKQLRNMPVELTKTVYIDTNEKTRVVPFMKPKQILVGYKDEPNLDENGIQVLDASGEPTFTKVPVTQNAPHFGGHPMNGNSSGLPQLAQINTYTRELGMCIRKMYHGLKTEYNREARV